MVPSRIHARQTWDRHDLPRRQVPLKDFAASLEIVRAAMQGEWRCSVSLVGQTTVTGNGGARLSLTNLSSLVFDFGTASVSGNLGAADVVCNPSYTTVTLNNA